MDGVKKIDRDYVLSYNKVNIKNMHGGYTNNPITIQEKLRYLNINDIPWSNKYNIPLKSVCADKFLVKEYSEEKIGKNIGVPVLFCYKNTEEICWENLPNKFVIKVNHNSGGWIICRNKKTFNKDEAIKKLNKWLNEDFTFKNGFESHYHWIQKRIIVEELLEDFEQRDSLFDYKFWCFNGEPKLYTINDGNGHGDIMYYDMNDNELNLYGIKNKKKYLKPSQFNTMVEYAKLLSEDFKFVRVDFYEVNGNIYLGELTFTPGCCTFKYCNDEYNINIGKLLNLDTYITSECINLNKTINLLIVHYNTPELTEYLIKSINKFIKVKTNIYIFDNSDKYPFVYKQDNITYIDNTKGQIIDFEKWLKQFPNRLGSGAIVNNYGSAKHCISVEKAMDIINDNFILLDSDILLKKDITSLFNESYISIGDTELFGLKAKKERIVPFLCFINVNECKNKNIHYFDPKRMFGLNSGSSNELYDTGGSFYEDIKNLNFKKINVYEFIEHYRAGSWTEDAIKKHNYKTIPWQEWIDKNQRLWKMNNDVIYTCITGDYDVLTTPSYIDSKFDYICFSDNLNLKSNIWNIRPIPEELRNLSKVKQQRIIKINAHKYLSEYNLSVWIDGSVDIKSDLKPIVDSCTDGSVFIPEHPNRNCIYKEGAVCIQIKKDTAENVNKQLNKYKQEGFPENYGLVQSNIIIRYHNDLECIRLMETWAEELLNNSRRDQLSFNYALWKIKTKCFKPLSKTLCHSEYFSWDSTHRKNKYSNQNVIIKHTNVNKLQQNHKIVKNKITIYKRSL